MVPLIPIVAALVQYAPVLAGLLGGPKAADMATAVVDIAKQVTGTTEPGDALAGIQSDPELAVRFKTAVMDNELALARLAAEGRKTELDHTATIAQVDQADRASARGMRQASRSKVPDVLAGIIVFGFFVVLIGGLSGWLKLPDNPLLLALVGALVAAFGQVLNFHFGSSQGSKDKGAELSRLR